jgi:hypothetical protein
MADIYIEKPSTVGELVEYLKQFEQSLPLNIESVGGEYQVSAIYDYSDSTYNKRIVIAGPV